MAMVLSTHVLAAGGVLVSLLAVPSGGDSAAAAAPSWLQWTRGPGAETCPDAVAFAARVEAELGSGAARGAAIESTVAVNVGRGPSVDGARSWSADLRLIARDGTPAGSRHLDSVGDSCDLLTNKLALMVALLLAGDVTLTGKEPQSPPASPARSAAAATPAPARAAENATPRPAPSGGGADAVPPPQAAPSAPWTLAIEAGALVGLGLLPRLAAAIDARFWATPGRGPALFASGSVWRSQRALLEGDADSGADLGLWTIGLGLCPLVPRVDSGPALVACVIGDVGRLGATGFGFGQNLSKSRWTGDAGLEGDFRQYLGRLTFLSFGVRLVAPLTRDDIIYRQDAGGTTLSIFRVAPVVATVGLRLGAVVP